MNGEALHRINSVSFRVCLISVECAVLIGVLGVWDIIPQNSALLWRALGTCGVFFGGAVLASMALGCFKTNE